LETDVAKVNANYMWYGTPVLTALPLINPEIRNNVAVNPSPAQRAKMFIREDLSSEIHRNWATMFNKIKAYKAS